MTNQRAPPEFYEPPQLRENKVLFEDLGHSLCTDSLLGPFALQRLLNQSDSRKQSPFGMVGVYGLFCHGRVSSSSSRDLRGSLFVEIAYEGELRLLSALHLPES